MLTSTTKDFKFLKTKSIMLRHIDRFIPSLQVLEYTMVINFRICILLQIVKDKWLSLFTQHVGKTPWYPKVGWCTMYDDYSLYGDIICDNNAWGKIWLSTVGEIFYRKGKFKWGGLIYCQHAFSSFDCRVTWNNVCVCVCVFRRDYYAILFFVWTELEPTFLFKL